MLPTGKYVRGKGSKPDQASIPWHCHPQSKFCPLASCQGGSPRGHLDSGYYLSQGLCTSTPISRSFSFQSAPLGGVEVLATGVLPPSPCAVDQASSSPRAEGVGVSEMVGSRREHLQLSSLPTRPAPGSSTGADARISSYSSLRHPSWLDSMGMMKIRVLW